MLFTEDSFFPKTEHPMKPDGWLVEIQRLSTNLMQGCLIESEFQGRMTELSPRSLWRIRGDIESPLSDAAMTDAPEMDKTGLDLSLLKYQ